MSKLIFSKILLRPIFQTKDVKRTPNVIGTLFGGQTNLRYISSSNLSRSFGHRYWRQTTKVARVESLFVQTISARFSHDTTKRIKPFILPDIGEGINEVEIKSWLVNVGDSVREFDSLCEVESDKATATISSRFEGVIAKIHYESGEMAKVGSPLVDIQMSSLEVGAQSDEKPKQKQEVDTARKTESPVLQETTRKPQIATLPSVRRLASEQGIDLSQVIATGKNGQVLKEDVLSYLGRRSASGDGSTGESSNRSSRCAGDNKEIQIPLRGIRRAMFKTMTQSAKIPHFNYADEIDMTRLVEASTSWREDQKISNLAVIIKLVSMALHEFPQLNGSVDESGEFMIEKRYHNIGVAVDSGSGLIVPNIKGVESLSVMQINSELTRLRQLAYDSKLGPTDLSGGTLTLSNIGAIGGVFGVPVLVSPEIVIGALGRTRKLPRFNSAGQIEARHVMQLVWSADHRVVDGATLSRFTNLLKRFLQEPERALIRLK